MNYFKKALLITLLSTTSIYQVHAQSASAFNAMYYKARQGDLPGLVNMVSGGVNVDMVNSNGDTGLCLAAKSRDMRAYNTFLSAGADSAHSCTTEIPGYTTFAKRSGYQTYEYTAPERSVYGGSDGSGAIYGNTKHASAVYTGSENSSHTIAPGWYWAGGIVLAGAGVALALGGGGGGGGGSGDSDPGLTCVDGCAVYDTKGRCTVCRDHLFVQSVDAESLENDQALESAPAVEGWLPWGGGTHAWKIAC